MDFSFQRFNEIKEPLSLAVLAVVSGLCLEACYERFGNEPHWAYAIFIPATLYSTLGLLNRTVLKDNYNHIVETIHSTIMSASLAFLASEFWQKYNLTPDMAELSFMPAALGALPTATDAAGQNIKKELTDLANVLNGLLIMYMGIMMNHLDAVITVIIFAIVNATQKIGEIAQRGPAVFNAVLAIFQLSALLTILNLSQ